MKSRNILFVGIFFIILTSCNKNEEISIKEIESQINVDIPLETISSSQIKSQVNISENEFAFSGSKDYRLNNIINSSSGISNIYNIVPNVGSVLSVTNIEEGNKINSLMLHWGYKSATDISFAKNDSINLLSMDYTMSNGMLQVNIDNVIDKIVNSIDDSNVTLQFRITGKSDLSLSCIANLQIQIIVESKIFTPRFELF